MGLVLFPGDDDTSSPDVSWSYTGFGVFRRWLAQAEGFALDEMHGFGGQRPWNDVSTTLAPLLNRPDDDGPDLSPIQAPRSCPASRRSPTDVKREAPIRFFNGTSTTPASWWSCCSSASRRTSSSSSADVGRRCRLTVTSSYVTALRALWQVAGPSAGDRRDSAPGANRCSVA
ncbi:hypothetical protein [Streptomyces sp. LN704]|uniref:hypothetical protein n=1 Tax=Streptomyces sp. LN704 TaxID=3112982 RepID=UPI00371A0EC4